MTDQYFTPADVAEQLVSSFKTKNERCVADFAAGDGELLKAAQRKWRVTSVVATDINARTVIKLRRRNPSWTVSRCDFLNPDSRKRCGALRDLVGKVSLALLNPPFTCQGGERHSVQIDDKTSISCSRAMAFVLLSLSFLARNGRLAAILPASSFSSQKDSKAWEYIRRRFAVSSRTSFGPRTFPDCAAKTVIVTISRRPRPHKKAVPTHNARLEGKRLRVKVIRGATSMHHALNGWAGSLWPLVHTTDMRENELLDSNRKLRLLRRHVSGPAVLLPRVGKPDIKKCVLYLQRRRIVLSDCVYGIACKSRENAEELHSRLQRRWEELIEPAYCGTCAPYLTVKQLTGVLTDIGCTVTEIEAAGCQLSRFLK